MLKGKITTFICTQCGELFYGMKKGAKCQSCSIGEIKGYHIFNALTIRTLNRAGFNVLDYTFSKAACLDREIRIEFADAYDFSPFKPPVGFVYGSMQKPTDQSDKGRSVALLYKRYKNDMPNWEYAFQSVIDKLDLMQWSFTLPIKESLHKDNR